jgi:hypothetical protein
MRIQIEICNITRLMSCLGCAAFCLLAINRVSAADNKPIIVLPQ